MERLMLVSADGHTGAQNLDAFRPYLEQRFWSDLDELAEQMEPMAAMLAPIHTFTSETLDIIDDRDAIRSGGLTSIWDPERRLRELDQEGIAGEVLIAGAQGGALPFFRGQDAELRSAGVAAYHRWQADYMAGAGGRFVGLADPGPCLDMEATVRELHWLADHGFVSIGVPGIAADPRLPPLYDSYFEPFWAACAELGLVLSVHAGWGQDPEALMKFFERLSEMGELDVNNMRKVREQMQGSDSPMALDIGPRRVFWQLMLAGAFDRHPDLKLVFTEVRADWIPPTLAYLDQRFVSEDAPLAIAPSEYYRRHCGVAPSSPRRPEVEMRHDIGLTQMMFGVDYPHPEGTWPNTRDWIRATFGGVPEDEARLILGENAVNWYRMDREALAKVAERIGPKPEEVLGDGHHVDSAKIDQFNKRAGYLAPAETINTDSIDAAIEHDLAGLAGTGAR